MRSAFWGAGPRPAAGSQPALVLALALSLAPAFAQSTITGILRSNGLPIPGATITATQGSKKLVTTTDETGRYEFDNVAPGTWTLQAEMLAFGTIHRDVTVASAPLDVNLNMIVAAAPQPPQTSPGPRQ